MIQNLVVKRGEKFKETFNLRKPDGSRSSGVGYTFTIVVYRRDFVKEFQLSNRGSHLDFNLTAAQTSSFDSNVLSYKIVVTETKEEIAHGLLRVM